VQTDGKREGRPQLHLGYPFTPTPRRLMQAFRAGDFAPVQARNPHGRPPLCARTDLAPPDCEACAEAGLRRAIRTRRRSEGGPDSCPPSWATVTR
jgi:hypothetical protein